MHKLTTIASVGLLAIVFSTSADANKNNSNKNKNKFNHCTRNASQASECQSPLGESTYNLMQEGVASGTTPAASSVNIAGVNVSISSWADTSGSVSYDDGTWAYNDKVVSAGELERFSGGYGVSNSQDGWYSHDHAIDNHGVDVLGVDTADYDFLLLSFDSNVTLTGASFGWADSKYNTQVSVAGLSDISALTSGNSSWKSIIGQSLSTGSFDVTYCDPGYKSTFNFTSSAQYWLVGAYNTVFGDIGGTLRDDAFKLASVGFNKDPSGGSKPSTEVSEPATFGLLLAGGLLAGWRKKRINQQQI